MVRRTYRTTIRPFADDPTEVTIRWYPVEPGTPCLPIPSKINSLDWHTAPWLDHGPGEVWDAPRRFYLGRANPAATAKHYCGDPTWWALGEPPGLPLAPTEYDPSGLPLCCLPNVVGYGGAAGGGTAIVTGGGAYTSYGGAAGGGTAIVTYHAGTTIASGGAAGGGTAAAWSVSEVLGTGGAAGGGTAAAWSVSEVLGTGGAAGGGTAAAWSVSEVLGTGGAAGGGTAAAWSVSEVLGTGGAAGGGTAAAWSVSEVLGTGGAAGGGTASATSTITPGATAALAAVVAVGVAYPYVGPSAPLIDQWWVYHVANGTYTLSYSGLGVGANSVTLYPSATSSSSLGIPITPILEPINLNVTNGLMYVDVAQGTGSAVPYSFELTSSSPPPPLGPFIFNTPGATSITVPPGYATVTVRYARGGGGDGADGAGTTQAGGAGGGAGVGYCHGYPVSAGQVLPITIGDHGQNSYIQDPLGATIAQGTAGGSGLRTGTEGAGGGGYGNPAGSSYGSYRGGDGAAGGRGLHQPGPGGGGGAGNLGVGAGGAVGVGAPGVGGTAGPGTSVGSAGSGGSGAGTSSGRTPALPGRGYGGGGGGGGAGGAGAFGSAGNMSITFP